MQEELADEERVASRASDHILDVAFDARLPRERGDMACVESLELNRRAVREPPKIRQYRRQRRAREVRVPIGRDEQETWGTGSGQMPKQKGGGLIRPVEVVDNDDRRPCCAQRREASNDVTEQLGAVELERSGRLSLPIALSRRDSRQDLGGRVLRVRTRARKRGTQDFGERLERRPDPIIAPSDERDGVGPQSKEFGDETRLPGSGLPDDVRGRAHPIAGLLPSLLQLGQGALSAHEVKVRCDRKREVGCRTQCLPAHSVRLDRTRQALESEEAGFLEGRAFGQEQLDHKRDKYFPGSCHCAQPRGHDQRQAEPATIPVDARLAGVDANSQTDTVQARCTLVHLAGSRSGLRGARERCHDSVTRFGRQPRHGVRPRRSG